MIQCIAYGLKLSLKIANIHDHTRCWVWVAAKCDLSTIAMAMDPQARLGLNFAMQSVGCIKKELFAELVHHRIPTVLCV